MSLVLVSYQITDHDGDVDTVPIYIPQGTLTLADVSGFADDLAPVIDSLTDGQITGISLTFQQSLPGGLDPAPVANSEVQKGGLFKFRATGTNYTHSVRIPAFVPGKFVGDTIDDTDVDVIAFLSAMVTGLTPVATLVSPSNKYEMDLASHVVAVKSFRK